MVRVALEAARRGRHQVGHRGEIPVGARHVHVAEVGGQGGDVLIDVHPRLVPPQQHTDGEGVAQIMDARRRRRVRNVMVTR